MRPLLLIMSTAFQSFILRDNNKKQYNYWIRLSYEQKTPSISVILHIIPPTYPITANFTLHTPHEQILQTSNNNSYRA